MEADKNPFPKFELFDPIENVKQVARFIGERLLFLGNEPSYTEQFHQPELDFEE